MSTSRTFFDGQAQDYRSLGIGNEASNDVAARRIEAGVRGSVLSVGGLWDQAKLPPGVRVIAADLSKEMLRAFAEPGVSLVQCDARALPFAGSSVDHAVLPLMLHHLAEGSAWDARRQVRRALQQLRAIVRPGGMIWINEICVQAAIYGLELLAGPLTSKLLSLLGQSLVVFHSRSFYEETLRETGWTDISAEPIVAPDAKPLDLVVPVLGMPWFRIPRFAFPIRPTLFSARRPPDAT
jgi:SAM-dependent methyltransferase